MESVAPLVRLFFGELIATLRRSEPHPEREPWPVTIMFDEFDQIGRMPVIISSLKQLRSHNARVSIITQSVPGLHSTGYSEQMRIAARLRRDALHTNLLNWSHIPNTQEFNYVCEIIISEIAGSRGLKDYQIHDGAQLAAVITKIRMSETLREFLDDRVRNRRVDQSPSDAIDQGLRFLRNYLCFTFPRQLSAIEAIHKDIESRAGRKSAANYQMFIAMAEVMFMDPNVFILDEFGIPFSLGSKLLPNPSPDETLQEAVERILSSGEGTLRKLHPFELDIFESVAPGLPRG